MDVVMEETFGPIAPIMKVLSPTLSLLSGLYNILVPGLK